MDSSSKASPNNSDLTHLARVWISGLSIARIDPARVLYIACMINPGSIWIGYHQMKIVFYFYFYFCCIHKYQCRDSQKPANVIITKWLRSNRHWDLWVITSTSSSLKYWHWRNKDSTRFSIVRPFRIMRLLSLNQESSYLTSTSSSSVLCQKYIIIIFLNLNLDHTTYRFLWKQYRYRFRLANVVVEVEVVNGNGKSVRQCVCSSTLTSFSTSIFISIFNVWNKIRICLLIMLFCDDFYEIIKIWACLKLRN